MPFICRLLPSQLTPWCMVQGGPPLLPGSVPAVQQNLEEGDHQMKVFIGNSYPCSFIHSASAARAPREDDWEREEERPPTVHLPYVAGVSERIRRCVRISTSEWCSSPDPFSVHSSLRTRTPS